MSQITAILIFKWVFVISIILLSVYHYFVERNKINTLSKFISDPKIVSSLRASARTRMGHFFLLFSAFIVWILSYDIEFENVNEKSRQKDEQIKELNSIVGKYKNITNAPTRLVKASSESNDNLVADIKNYYQDIFVNYYVMRKCDMVETDDIFIINSALVRELSLNNIRLELRDEIIKNAKKQYLKKFSDFQCNQIYGQHNDLIKNYQNYIIAVRELLKATF